MSDNPLHTLEYGLETCR